MTVELLRSPRHKAKVPRVLTSPRMIYPREKIVEVLGEVKFGSAGGAGNKILMVLRGQGDYYFNGKGISKWDLCAGEALLMAMGGGILNLDGSRIDYANDEVTKVQNGFLVSGKSG